MLDFKDSVRARRFVNELQSTLVSGASITERPRYEAPAKVANSELTALP
jgi:hypothetical protein